MCRSTKKEVIMSMTRTNVHFDEVHKNRLSTIQERFGIGSAAEACRFAIERFDFDLEENMEQMEILNSQLSKALKENEETFIQARAQMEKLIIKMEAQANE